ncbi:MAG: flagellar protein F [Candidatus Thermoplasmatota archaeon]|nr:flagellar protein F [Candidatus Thermoplasmatota archaeon]
MGFSYVVAVAVLLSSSLIFFGVIYSDYVHADTELNSAQQGFNTLTYNLENSRINITGYQVKGLGPEFNVTLNITNTGSVTLDLRSANVLVNGTLVQFNYSDQYLFPLGDGNVTFQTTSGPHSVELVFSTGYEKFQEVNV